MTTTTTTVVVDDDADVSLLDCPYWVAATTLSPAFAPTYDRYVTRGGDRCGGAFLRSLGVRAGDYRVGLASAAEAAVASPTTTTTTTTTANEDKSEHACADKAQSRASFPYLMAMPLCVPRSCCDSDAHGDGDSDDDDDAHVSAGMLTMLSDLLTSYHIMLAQLPHPLAHVSVSMQCRVCAPLRAGGRYVAVSTLDKLGQRILYCTVRILAAQPAAAHARHACTHARTLDDVRALMDACTTLATVTHIKSNVRSTSAADAATAAAKQAGEHGHKHDDDGSAA